MLHNQSITLHMKWAGSPNQTLAWKGLDAERPIQIPESTTLQIRENSHVCMHACMYVCMYEVCWHVCESSYKKSMLKQSQ